MLPPQPPPLGAAEIIGDDLRTYEKPFKGAPGRAPHLLPSPRYQMVCAPYKHTLWCIRTPLEGTASMPQCKSYKRSPKECRLLARELAAPNVFDEEGQ
jgi:hypothetical protein